MPPRLSIAAILATALLSGCGTLPDGRRWGENAIVPLPAAERIGRAAWRAALDPLTWAPAVGAAVFQIDGYDRKVSDWATRNTPVFGSLDGAGRADDILLGVLGGAAGASILAATGGRGAGEWALAKVRGMTVEAAGVGTALGITAGLKAAVGRQRPFGKGTTSFPSGHSTAGAALGTVAARNLDCLSLPDAAGAGLKAATWTTVAAGAWARVEDGSHYPADVLAGIAIGHFAAVFFHDAFLGLPEKGMPWIEIDPLDRGALVTFSWAF